MTAEGGKRAPSNADADWSRFDAARYFHNNYSELREEDKTLIRATAGHFARHGKLAKAFDVGTGSNLYPVLCLLPFAQSIDCLEYGTGNVAWLNARLEASALEPPWPESWEVVRAACNAPDMPEHPAMSLRHKVHVRQRSIFSLPTRNWDAGTMFFVAESITGKPAEFDLACQRFLDALRPGSPYAAAFMTGSEGYTVAGIEFPAVAISESHIEAALEPGSADLSILSIPIAGKPLRAGYTGMVLALGQAA